MIYDLDIKFLFYDGGLGGDALARAITCRLPLSNNYDTSYCDKSLNKHSCNDIFSGIFQENRISKELAEKLNLSTIIIANLPTNEKKILLEFCFKLWLVSWETSEYDNYNYKGTKEHYFNYIKSFKLVVTQKLNTITGQLVDYLKTCKIPSNLPKGPYLAKGHHLKWESELATFFSKYENIYLTISKDDNQINFKDKLWAFNVLWYIKTGKTGWDDLGYISQDRAFNYFPEALTCLKPELWYQPTYTFDAYKLVVLEQTPLSKKLLKIFNLNLNGVVHDFLRNNAKLNQEMVKEFKYDQNFQV